VNKLPNNYWKVFSASVISGTGSGIASVALPWIASSLTRNPLAISLVALAGQLPWILFTLHAGVLVDRLDKKKILIFSDIIRGVITALIALFVIIESQNLGKVDQVNKDLVGTRWGLLTVIILAELALGFVGVLADNTSQAVVPSVVEKDQLQHANGRMWAAISVSEQFIGPPIGSFLLGIAAFLPLLIDAGSFFLSAGLILLVTAQLGQRREFNENDVKPTFAADIKEGFQWLWSHKIFKTLALSLGFVNMLNGLATGIFILFAQEVLKVSVFQFSLLGTGFAIGAIIGGSFGPRISMKLGDSKSLAVAMIGIGIASLVTAINTNWIIYWLTGIFTAMMVLLWNIVTVSFRQAVIPDHLFGRVNSVYRFFGTGSSPIGALLGAIIVSIAIRFVDREIALRIPFAVAALGMFFIFAITRNSLSEKEFLLAKHNQV